MQAKNESPLFKETAEWAVLGALLDGCEPQEVFDRLTPEHFYSTPNRNVYEAIQLVHEEHGKVVDVLVHDQLVANFGKTAIQDIAHMHDILDCLYAPENCPYYVGLIEGAFRRRVAKKVATQLAKGAEDPEFDAIPAACETLRGLSDTTKQSSVVTAKDIIRDVLKGIEERYHSKTLLGLPTGFADIDTMTSGLQKSELTLLAGRTSMGKSMLAHNVILHVAIEKNLPVLLFSTEMSRVSVMHRMLSILSGVPLAAIRDGRSLTPGDWEKITVASSQLHTANIMIDGSSSLRLAGLLSECRGAARGANPPALIVVDFIQEVRPNSRMELYEAVTETSQELKGIARELDVPVLALSQLNRGPERRADQRPLLSDLRESGSLEQDADVVMMLHRDDYFQHDVPAQDFVEVVIRKNRNGPTGSVKLGLLAKTMRFTDLQGVY